jgi:hypothetical protein
MPATRVEETGSGGRLELVTDNVTKEVARLVVENDDGTRAVFFITLTFNKHKKPCLEVVGKRKGAGVESEGHACGDWLPTR